MIISPWLARETKIQIPQSTAHRDRPDIHSLAQPVSARLEPINALMNGLKLSVNPAFPSIGLGSSHPLNNARDSRVQDTIGQRLKPQGFKTRLRILRKNLGSGVQTVEKLADHWRIEYLLSRFGHKSGYAP